MRRRKVDVRESLRSSFKDGIFAAFMAGVTDHYATPLALLGATVQQVGFVTALPNLFSSLSQFFAVRVIYWVGGRLKLLVRLVFSQASLIFDRTPALARYLQPRGTVARSADFCRFVRRLGWACLGQLDERLHPVQQERAILWMAQPDRGRCDPGQCDPVGADTLFFGDVSYRAGFCILFLWQRWRATRRLILSSRWMSRRIGEIPPAILRSSCLSLVSERAIF